MDVFLHEIDHHKTEKITPNYYTDEQFAMVLVDLFITGFVPTASCLEFLIMFMILHPEIQKKCHEEIDMVIGRSRFPSINDNEKLPYTQAVCLEVLRHVTFIPMTTRAATKDTQIDDYFIPKGTIAALNLYGMHHDKQTWENPLEFNPDRFLDKDGKLCNQDIMLPFGTGKRTCPAEVFARISTFTYFTYLLQKYSFECPSNSAPPDSTPSVGMGNYAKPYRCVVRDRQLVSSNFIANYKDSRDEDCGTLV
ncbi:Cytochrome P450 2D9 [Orchesella cincta]|uniref:Cytochrome P450 2D9 n=1 Tax=Orchesella cincta TaxID=48709 RepID=A0A1D2MTL0_ORCCI|nr:Cytochrome P450 2D9 [Orchesella cincta]